MFKKKQSILAIALIMSMIPLMVLSVRIRPNELKVEPSALLEESATQETAYGVYGVQTVMCYKIFWQSNASKDKFMWHSDFAEHETTYILECAFPVTFAVMPELSVSLAGFDLENEGKAGIEINDPTMDSDRRKFTVVIQKREHQRIHAVKISAIGWTVGNKIQIRTHKWSEFPKNERDRFRKETGTRTYTETYDTPSEFSNKEYTATAFLTAFKCQNEKNLRLSIKVENVNSNNYDIEYKTWSDSKISDFVVVVIFMEKIRVQNKYQNYPTKLEWSEKKGKLFSTSNGGHNNERTEYHNFYAWRPGTLTCLYGFTYFDFINSNNYRIMLDKVENETGAGQTMKTWDHTKVYRIQTSNICTFLDASRY